MFESQYNPTVQYYRKFAQLVFESQYNPTVQYYRKFAQLAFESQYNPTEQYYQLILSSTRLAHSTGTVYCRTRIRHNVLKLQYDVLHSTVQYSTVQYSTAVTRYG